MDCQEERGWCDTLWGSVTCAAEGKVGCVLNKAQGAGARGPQTIVYTWERNSEWLGSAWLSCTFSNNLWEALRIICSSFPLRLRFWLTPWVTGTSRAWTSYLKSHCKWSLFPFLLWPDLLQGRNWRSPAEAEHSLGLQRRPGALCSMISWIQLYLTLNF